MQNKHIDDLGKLNIGCEVYVVSNNKVLLLKRSDTAKNFPGFWIGPGGHVDDGEDVLTAAIREVNEETGVLIDEQSIKLKVLSFHHHIDKNQVWIEYLFRATINKVIETSDTNEGITKWFDVSEVANLKNIFPPTEHYFNHILPETSGILYEFSRWNNSELVEIVSRKIDTSL